MQVYARAPTPTPSPYHPTVGEDYFCETGVPPGQDASADSLWDGDGCGPTSACCTFSDPPWFCKQLPQTSYYDIEEGICSTQGLIAENVPLRFM